MDEGFLRASRNCRMWMCCRPSAPMCTTSCNHDVLAVTAAGVEAPEGAAWHERERTTAAKEAQSAAVLSREAMYQIIRRR